MDIDRGRSQSNYLSLRDAIDQLVAGSYITPGRAGGFPPADLYLTDDEVVLELAVPGANPDDINISVTGDAVTVAGEIAHAHPQGKGHTYVSEIGSGRFERSFPLPIEVNPGAAEASYQNGILTLTLPKSEATKPRKIQVRSGRE